MAGANTFAWCRIVASTTLAIAAFLSAREGAAQVAPMGTHYAGRASDTGHAPSDNGGYATSIPLDLPPSRGGLPIPVQIVSGTKGFGAAGVGWDVPLSFVQVDGFYAHRRPALAAAEPLSPRSRITVSLPGRRLEMVAKGDEWIARYAPDVTMQFESGKYKVYDGNGLTYTFSTDIQRLFRTGLYLLESITGPGGATVKLEYDIAVDASDGRVLFNPVSIDLVQVSYNPHPAAPNCFKHQVRLAYTRASEPLAPKAISVVGARLLVRESRLTQVDVLSRATCADSPERLRRYSLTYSLDTDTRQERLSSVKVQGRSGTPEASVSLPIAEYGYGSATIGGALHFGQFGQVPTDIDLPLTVETLARTAELTSAEFQAPVSVSPWPFFSPKSYGARASFVDITGDGRPDAIFQENGTLMVSRNVAGESGAPVFAAPVPLNDNNFTRPVLDIRSAPYGRLAPDPTTGFNLEDIWTQTIDVNGDGRLDIVDAAVQPGFWVVYLNTPSSDASGVRWESRSYDVRRLYAEFEALGLIADYEGYLPLSRRFTGRDHYKWICWRKDDATATFIPWPVGDVGISPACIPTGDLPSGDTERTYVEWEVKDLNGDGYPDVVFNSSPIDFMSDATTPPPYATPQITIAQPVPVFAGPTDRNNEIRAVLNVRGVFITQDAVDPFSAPFVFSATHDRCGLGAWTTRGLGSFDRRTDAECDIMDVNGDLLADYVTNRCLPNTPCESVAFLGTGAGLQATSIVLPGAPSIQDTNRREPNGDDTCETHERYTARFRAALRDFTGDGIPDYVNSTSNQQELTLEFQIRVGTGAGFASPVPIVGDFEISRSSESCNPALTDSRTGSGLFDLDGDGKAESVDIVAHSGGIWALRPFTVARGTDFGNPEAGRLTEISNGHGARTHIAYTSAKRDWRTRHDVPFPEIVVSSIETKLENSNRQFFRGQDSAARYAYGNISMFYDPISDGFRSLGYLRNVNTRITSADRPPQFTANITDRYPLEQFDASMTGAQRFGRYQRAGRVKEVATLATVSSLDPWPLLSADLATDPRQSAGASYIVGLGDTRLFSDTSPPGDDLCIDVPFPYDFERSENAAVSFNTCSARGFLFTRATLSWRGARPPPSSDNVQVLSEVRTVDDFGRVTSAAYKNDATRDDDDVCVDTQYATPVSINTHVLTAASSRKVWDCADFGESPVVFAEEAWTYDKLFANMVSQGLVTAHTTNRRRADTGEFLNTIYDFELDYDLAANPIKAVRERDIDNARQTTAVDYDAFGLLPVRLAVSGTNVPTLATLNSFDLVTSELLSSIDENGTAHGTTFDGFGRPRFETIDTPEAELGVLRQFEYLGFEGGTSGRSVVEKEFTDPVPFAQTATSEARATTTYLDELGRVRYAAVGLGSDYASQDLLVGGRKYDALGRVVFEADPYPSTQEPTTAYGTTQYFAADGTLQLSVRGRGPQIFSSVPDAATERFPTLFSHSFSNHTEVRVVQGPDSLTPSSPQSGVYREEVVSAIGQVLSRSTWQAPFMRLELADFRYDRLGHQTEMTRYRDSAGATEPVPWSWRFDSLGQLLSLSEPEATRQVHSYSSWGELLQTQWSPPLEATHSVVRQYDAFGRLTRTEERNQGVVDPATINQYSYDVPSSASSVPATNVLGRLTSASAPTGSVALSYDGQGRVNTRTHRDPQNVAYVESHGFHGDGSQAWIELKLLDNRYRPERLDYEYDSAGRLRWMWYLDGSSTQELYNASTIDAWGRVRSATFGKTQFDAVFDDVGRRLPKKVSVVGATNKREIFFTSFDSAGREVSREERLPNFAGNQTVSYDALGRLRTSTRTHVGNGQPASQWTFQYDALGNTVALQDHLGTQDATLSYRSADRDRLCRIAFGDAPDTSSTCNVEHDQLGNVTVEPTRTGSRRLTYFNSGNVRSLETTSGMEVTESTFRYDPFGALQTLDVKTGDVLVQSERNFGAFVTKHFQKTGTRGGTEYVERRFPGPGLVASRRGAKGPWIFQFSEARGTRFTVDERGEFIQDLDYTPYGESSSSGASPLDTTFTASQWNGGETSGVSGLVRLGARFYDPLIGRFLSRDPLLATRTASLSNPYGFAFNDPINYSDPTGLDPPCGWGPCEQSAGDTSVWTNIAAAVGTAVATGFDAIVGSGSAATSAANAGDTRRLVATLPRGWRESYTLATGAYEGALDFIEGAAYFKAPGTVEGDLANIGTAIALGAALSDPDSLVESIKTSANETLAAFASGDWSRAGRIAIFAAPVAGSAFAKLQRFLRGGQRLALGLKYTATDGSLSGFATRGLGRFKAKTYWDFYRDGKVSAATIGERVLPLIDKAKHIHFRLDGMINAYFRNAAEIFRAGSQGLAEGNVSNWEFYQAATRCPGKVTCHIQGQTYSLSELGVFSE